MLNAMRKRAGSWVVKIFLGLLVASFAVWGIGDIFRVQPDTPVVEIGDIEVSQEEFRSAYNRELRQMQRQFGGNLTGQLARQLGLVDRTVGSLVDRSLYDLAAHSFDLTASDATVLKMIRENPSFQNSLGQFDRCTYENTIRQAGFTEDRFVRLSRKDAARQQLIDSFGASVTAPKQLLDNLVLHQQQRRRFTRLKFENSAVGDVPDPTDEQLTAFHKENENDFKAPEYRVVRYFVIEPESLFDQIDISDTAIEEAYQDRLNEFTIIETRELEQFVLPDEKTAVAAKDRLNAGDDFYEVAMTFAEAEEDDVKLGEFRKTELPEATREATFALNEGAISEPIKSDFGWHIIRATKVNPGRVAPLSEAKTRVVTDLKRDRAIDLIYELSQDVEDAFAGGASLTEVAQNFELSVKRIAAVDSTGKDQSGATVAELPTLSGFLGKVFATEVNTDLALEESESGAYFAIDVEDIIEVAVKPLDSVRTEVVDAWTEAEQRKLAEVKRDAILEKAKGGSTLDALSKAESADLLVTEAVVRGDLFRQENLDNGFVKQLYSAAPGDLFAAGTRTDDAQVIFRLDEVVAADLAEETAFRERVAEVMQRSLNEDLFAVLNLALQRQYEPKVNETLLEQLFEGDLQG